MIDDDDCDRFYLNLCLTRAFPLFQLDRLSLTFFCSLPPPQKAKFNLSTKKRSRGHRGVSGERVSECGTMMGPRRGHTMKRWITMTSDHDRYLDASIGSC